MLLALVHTSSQLRLTSDPNHPRTHMVRPEGADDEIVDGGEGLVPGVMVAIILGLEVDQSRWLNAHPLQEHIRILMRISMTFQQRSQDQKLLESSDSLGSYRSGDVGWISSVLTITTAVPLSTLAHIFSCLLLFGYLSYFNPQICPLNRLQVWETGQRSLLLLLLTGSLHQRKARP